MIQIDKEFYSSPYYFLLENNGNKYSLHFSVQKTLSEAKKENDTIEFKKDDVKKVLNYITKVLKEKPKKNTKKVKKDLEELVNSDGAMSNSKLPILDPRVHPRKTMDQTVAAASITNDPISRGYRTYYGESVDEDIKETNLAPVFGWEDTQNMSGPKTYKYLVKNLEVEPIEAIKRTKQFGKNPFKKTKKLTISEIQKQKMIKMVEDILMRKKQNNSDINKKEISVSHILRKNLNTLKKQADKEGITLSELIKLLKSE